MFFKKDVRIEAENGTPEYTVDGDYEAIDSDVPPVLQYEQPIFIKPPLQLWQELQPSKHKPLATGLQAGRDSIAPAPTRHRF